MSFASALENSVIEFIVVVCKKYGLNKSEVLNLWKNGETSVSKTQEVSKMVANTLVADALVTDSKELSLGKEELDLTRLKNLSKKELEELCRKYGVKVTGTKQELMTRLQNPEENQVKTRKPTSPAKGVTKPLVSTTSQVSPKTSSGTQRATPSGRLKPEIKCKPVLVKKKDEIIVRKSAHGNLVIPMTCLTVDPKLGIVIGKEATNGDVYPLEEEDIELCKQKKFKYLVPEEAENIEVEEETPDQPDEVDALLANPDGDIETEEELEEELEEEI